MQEKKTIYKYLLLEKGDFYNGIRCISTMPKGAQILTVQELNGQVYVWAKVDTLAPEMSKGRQFNIVWTGQQFADNSIGTYISTIILKYANSEIVLHIFDKGEML